MRDAYDSGVLGTNVLGSGFRHDMVVHRGAGAYICGEETGMLESLEGKRGQPRVKPPFPAVVGAFGCPTVINNVETLCCATHILLRGAEWFKAIGTDERNTGPKLYAISGHVERPGTYEYPIGVPFQTLLDGCGGMYRGRELKAFIPGGASAPMMKASDREIRMDFDTLAKAGSMLGSAAVIVMDDTTCMVTATLRLAKFFAHESCGQCTPCREGTNWMKILAAADRQRPGRGIRSRPPRARRAERRRDLALRPGRRRTGSRALAGGQMERRDPGKPARRAISGDFAALLRPGSRSLMPTLTIDGRTVEVPAGTNLIEAGLKVGVQIPHYCYHPRLSIVGQCRMCMVEIEGMGKLQAACSTQVMKDGMVVRTASPNAEEAQRAIMEFLLINHPLDCPICDQAGECGLQDYSYKHGQAFSRFRFEEKRTYPEKERIPLGPTVMLNMNRCIQCTRCVRFTEEIAKTSELGFFERGSHAEIGTFPGKPLDNPLSTCVVDICPVGALTSTRFRFAERVWYLDKNPSICTGCDVGCNITLEHKHGSIKRYKPRQNPDVNDFWMCDYGRSTHERYREIPRLAFPQIRRNGALAATGWKEALDHVAHNLRSRRSEGAIAFLGLGLPVDGRGFPVRQDRRFRRVAASFDLGRQRSDTTDPESAGRHHRA